MPRDVIRYCTAIHPYKQSGRWQDVLDTEV